MNELLKECNVCGEDKFFSEYYKGRNQCKKCFIAKVKKKREEAINNNKTQKCKECGVEKSITEFPITEFKCNECCKAERKENVLDRVADSMQHGTPKDNRNPIQNYKNILTQLMKNQENKCFYSGELLTLKKDYYNTISPERLDESIRGYNDINNLGAICQLFQSGSNPVNVEGSTFITSDMRNQILDEPEDIQRVSNEKGKKITIGTVYKKVINFNIDFNDEDEVKEEMKFLPNKMFYNKTYETFVVTNKEGKPINFGKRKHKTLQGRFKLAMDYWKGVYQNDYEINENNQYIEYFVCHIDQLNIIHICPETNFMTTYPEEFQNHKIYNEFPDCSPGKPQWSKEKFNLVKELSTREDSQERKDRIDKMINESRDIVNEYRNRNNDVKIEKHTELTFLANRFANEKSNKSLQGWKSGEYKDLFLTYYDKVCEHRFRCEYTNIPMSLSGCKDWHMSSDLYNSNEKYCGTNIAFVCEEFNTRFHWMPEHFKKFWDIEVPDYVKEKFNAIELNKYLIT
jgi:phosphoribosylformylglycinamidine (FGAM) synthase PurS component